MTTLDQSRHDQEKMRVAMSMLISKLEKLLVKEHAELLIKKSESVLTVEETSKSRIEM